jgi:type IV pilus assembly protein PilX
MKFEPSSSRRFRPRPNRVQRGAVLVVGLIFLSLMTLIGVTAFTVATQEERIAGNTRDRNRAFEAAEAALRECERYLSGAVPPVFSDDGTVDRGMYTPPAYGAKDRWETINWSTDPARVLTGRAGVAEQPRCIVQRMATVRSSNASQRAELPQPTAWSYQVTARGVGANPFTTVLLQTSYVRD